MATATEDKTYNGWTNYETWVAKLWMDNDEGSHNYWREQAAFLLSPQGIAAHRPRLGTTSFTDQEVAQWALIEQLKEQHEESMPDLGASLAADLLGAALSEVNWHEIASSLIEDAIDD